MGRGVELGAGRAAQGVLDVEDGDLAAGHEGLELVGGDEGWGGHPAIQPPGRSATMAACPSRSASSSCTAPS